MKPIGSPYATSTPISQETSPRGLAIESERIVVLVFAIRCAAAATLSCQISHFLRLDEPVWAAMSALIISQARFADTQLLSKSRVLGSLIGIAVCVGVHAATVAGAIPILMQMAVAVGACAVLTRRLLALRVAIWTCPVVLLASSSSAAVMTVAFDRGAEIILGVLVGVALHWLADQIPYRRLNR